MIVGGSRPSVDDALLDDAPTRAVRLMEQCWAQEPEDRPSGFDEIEKRLGAIVSSMEQASASSNGHAGSIATEVNPLSRQLSAHAQAGGQAAV